MDVICFSAMSESRGYNSASLEAYSRANRSCVFGYEKTVYGLKKCRRDFNCELCETGTSKGGLIPGPSSMATRPSEAFGSLSFCCTSTALRKRPDGQRKPSVYSVGSSQTQRLETE